eukprot:9902611-Alexandrium_andersonii.AAC.1
MREWRGRFCWTCLHGTAFQVDEACVLHWSGSLYEARWHEVTKFMVKVSAVLRVLRGHFSAAKYRAGVDQNGQAFNNGDPDVPLADRNRS